MSYLTGAQCSFEEMLTYREEKHFWISECFRTQEIETILVFRINMPGNIKKSAESLQIFEMGLRQITREFHLHSMAFYDLKFPFPAPEWLAVWAVRAPATLVKQLSIEIEEHSNWGRLYDIDVIDSKGNSLSRRALGYEARKCFLCETEAFVCAREGRHSMAELIHYVETKANQCF